MNGQTISANRTRGFSTVELVVSVGIILSISAVAIPTITKTLNLYRVNDAATQLAGILKVTRFEAIRRNTPINCVNAQGGPTAQVTVWSDNNSNGIADPGEKQIVLGVNATLVTPAAVPNAGALAAAAGVAALTPVNAASGSVKFDQRGAATPAAVYVFYVGNVADNGFRAVIVLPSGSVQIWTYTGDAPNLWQLAS